MEGFDCSGNGLSSACSGGCCRVLSVGSGLSRWVYRGQWVRRMPRAGVGRHPNGAGPGG